MNRIRTTTVAILTVAFVFAPALTSAHASQKLPPLSKSVQRRAKANAAAVGCRTVVCWRKHYRAAARHWWYVTCNRSVPVAIDCVFGAQAPKARAVSWCESRWRTWVTNGQYAGAFQMGYAERMKYGHGDTPMEQALAAHRYWLVAGWRPWACA